MTSIEFSDKDIAEMERHITQDMMRHSAELLRYEWTSGNSTIDAVYRAAYSVALTDIGEAARPGAPITLTVQFADVADAERFADTASKVTPLDTDSMISWEQWARFVAALNTTIDGARPLKPVSDG
jgi:hypothetical protein